MRGAWFQSKFVTGLSFGQYHMWTLQLYPHSAKSQSKPLIPLWLIFREVWGQNWALLCCASSETHDCQLQQRQLYKISQIKYDSRWYGICRKGIINTIVEWTLATAELSFLLTLNWWLLCILKNEIILPDAVLLLALLLMLLCFMTSF